MVTLVALVVLKHEVLGHVQVKQILKADLAALGLHKVEGLRGYLLGVRGQVNGVGPSSYNILNGRRFVAEVEQVLYHPVVCRLVLQQNLPLVDPLHLGVLQVLEHDYQE